MGVRGDTLILKLGTPRKDVAGVFLDVNDILYETVLPYIGIVCTCTLHAL